LNKTPIKGQEHSYDSSSERHNGCVDPRQQQALIRRRAQRMRRETSRDACSIEQIADDRSRSIDRERIAGHIGDHRIVTGSAGKLFDLETEVEQHARRVTSVRFAPPCSASQV
jgi:hypothetical protein